MIWHDISIFILWCIVLSFFCLKKKKKKKVECVENMEIQIYKFHYVLFEYNDFDIHEVLFIIPF